LPIYIIHLTVWNAVSLWKTNGSFLVDLPRVTGDHKLFPATELMEALRFRMKIELAPLESVTPYARNPRKNGDAVAKVAASIKEYGWRQPIVVDEERVIIAARAHRHPSDILDRMRKRGL
jgi:hypothetical protein